MERPQKTMNFDMRINNIGRSCMLHQASQTFGLAIFLAHMFSIIKLILLKNYVLDRLIFLKNFKIKLQMLDLQIF